MAKSGQPVPRLIWFYFDEPYWAKYSEQAAKFGLTEAMTTYSTRLKITPTRV